MRRFGRKDSDASLLDVPSPSSAHAPSSIPGHRSSASRSSSFSLARESTASPSSPKSGGGFVGYLARRFWTSSSKDAQATSYGSSRTSSDEGGFFGRPTRTSNPSKPSVGGSVGAVSAGAGKKVHPLKQAAGRKWSRSADDLTTFTGSDGKWEENRADRENMIERYRDEGLQSPSTSAPPPAPSSGLGVRTRKISLPLSSHPILPSPTSPSSSPIPFPSASSPSPSSAEPPATLSPPPVSSVHRPKRTSSLAANTLLSTSPTHLPSSVSSPSLTGSPPARGIPGQTHEMTPSLNVPQQHGRSRSHNPTTLLSASEGTSPPPPPLPQRSADRTPNYGGLGFSFNFPFNSNTSPNNAASNSEARTPSPRTPTFPISPPVINAPIDEDAAAESAVASPFGGPNKRASQIVLRSGFLLRKSDFTPPSSHAFSSSSAAASKTMDLSRGWKPYKLVLRGNKLFFYKVPSDKAGHVRDAFPTGLVQPPTPVESAAVAPAPGEEKRGAGQGRARRAFWGRGRHPELVVEEGEARTVKAGSPDALVHEMIFATEFRSEYATDAHLAFIQTVFLAYPTPLSVPPTKLALELHRCVATALAGPESDHERMRASTLVIARALVRRCTASEPLPTEASKTLVELAEEAFGEGRDAERKEIIALANGETSPRPTLPGLTDWAAQAARSPSPATALRPEIAAHLRQGLFPALFLALDPREFARQLHAFHLERLCAVDLSLEGIVEAADKDDGALLLRLFAFMPNRPHFITRLALHHILISSRQPAAPAMPARNGRMPSSPSLASFQSSPSGSLSSPASPSPTALRAQLIVHWIRTAAYLHRLGDAAGWMAVVLALSSRAVARLTRTWKRIGREDFALLEGWARTLADVGVTDVENARVEGVVLVPSSKVKSGKVASPVPYLGSVIDDIHNARKRASAPPAAAQEGLPANAVALGPCWDVRDAAARAAGVAEEARKAQEKDGPQAQAVLPEFAAFFQHMCGLPTPQMPQISLFLAPSLVCEPRLLGNTLADAKPPSTAHPSSVNPLVPLLFPAPLPYISLVDRYKILESAKESLASSRKDLSSQNLTALAHPSAAQSTAQLVRTQSSPSRARRNSVDLGRPTRAAGSAAGGADGISSMLHRREAFVGSMREMSSVGETLFRVTDGELVLKALSEPTFTSTKGDSPTASRRSSLIDSRPGSRRTSVSTLTGFPGSASPALDVHPRVRASLMAAPRRSSLPASSAAGTGSVRNSLAGSDTLSLQTEAPLKVFVKSGTLDRLVDVLVLGVEDLSVRGTDDTGLPILTAKKIRLTMDLNEYADVFFATYRSFCAPQVLFELLRKRFDSAPHASKELVDSAHPASENQFPSWSATPVILDDDEVDWEQVTRLRLGVTSALRFWLQYGGGIQDVLDEGDLYTAFATFLKDQAQRKPTADASPEASASLEAVRQAVVDLDKFFAIRTLRPEAVERDDDRKEGEAKTAEPKSTPALTPMQRLHDSTPEDLVNSLDTIGAAILRNISEQDLVATAEVFESQLAEREAWFSSRVQHSHTEADDIVISDIMAYVAVVESDMETPISRRLPASVRAAIKAFGILRRWALGQIIKPGIGLRQRQTRIERLLSAIEVCRARMASLSASLAGPEELDKGVLAPTVRSMVEAALTAALVSPESRVFVLAWQTVAKSRKASVDSFASFFSPAALRPAKMGKACAVDLGWIWERMLEVVLEQPEPSDLLISFDKRRYLFNLCCNAPQLGQRSTLTAADESAVSVLLQTMDREAADSIVDMRYLRDEAHREGELGRGASRAHRPFQRLITLQQEKNRRDRQLRERLVREKKEEQHRAEKRELEISRAMGGQGKKASKQSKRMTALLRPFRPLSIAFTDRSLPAPGDSSARKRLSELDFEPISKPALVLTLNAARAADFPNTIRSCTFQIMTEDGGYYLLQASTFDDAREWIASITKSAQASAAKRLTYLAQRSAKPDTPDAADHLSTLAGARKTARTVYGVDLSDLVRREHGEAGIESGAIPLIVERCLAEIESRGLTEIGIYRLSGSVSAVNALREALDRDVAGVDLTQGEFSDIHVVTGALKLWLRELREPLIPFASYQDFINAASMADYDDRMYTIRELIWNLPRPHFALLRRLIEHLDKVTDFEDQNQMFAHNLAIVFGPTLLKAPGGASSFMASMGNLGHASQLVKSLILQSHWLFDTETEPEAAAEADEQAEPSSSPGVGVETVIEEDENNEDASAVSAAEMEAAS